MIACAMLWNLRASFFYVNHNAFLLNLILPLLSLVIFLVGIVGISLGCALLVISATSEFGATYLQTCAICLIFKK